MIGYKKSILERQSLSEVKMSRGSPICDYSDNLEKSLCKGQGEKYILHACEFQALRRHCIKKGMILSCK